MQGAPSSSPAHSHTASPPLLPCTPGRKIRTALNETSVTGGVAERCSCGAGDGCLSINSLISSYFTVSESQMFLPFYSLPVSIHSFTFNIGFNTVSVVIQQD